MLLKDALLQEVKWETQIKQTNKNERLREKIKKSAGKALSRFLATVLHLE
jgi:hypothetical protein